MGGFVHDRVEDHDLHRTSSEDLESAWSSEAVIYVNGVRRILPDGLAHLTLLQYLRGMGLTGTKLACGEGGCGACTVMISSFDVTKKETSHFAVNACLAPLYSVEGMHVITVEGVGDHKRLHPIQAALMEAHGSQCGFCTPGFIMSMYALLRSSTKPLTEQQIEECFSGNLCRCTGYRSIVDAFRVFARTNHSLYTNGTSESILSGTMICPSTGKPCSCGNDDIFSGESLSVINNREQKPDTCNSVDGNLSTDKELIFPPELLLREIKPLRLHGFAGIKWFRPLNLQQVLYLKSCFPEAKLVVGNTEVGIETKFKSANYKVLICLTHVPELNVLEVKNDGIVIGSSVRLAELQRVLMDVICDHDKDKTSSCKAILEQLKWFAGTQIRNVASVGGNICTASPISDLNPLWMASGAKFVVIDCKGHVRTVLAKEFFVGYRKVNIRDDEILLSIYLPWTRRFEFLTAFKQSHRREDDIALVNAGMRAYLTEEERGWIVSEVSIVYGGVAAMSVSASKTENFLTGKRWDKELLSEALEVLKEDVILGENAPGGMIEFRKSLTLSFFYKFFMMITHEMHGSGVFKEGLHPSELSAVLPYNRPVSSGNQSYEMTRHGTSVGLPMIHTSSHLQVTGGAEYTDDLPAPPHTLHAALVLSTKPHARILSIDDSMAKSHPGYVTSFLSNDIPGSNKFGPVIRDEELFSSGIITCIGQVIGVLVADTHENARSAANKIKIEYEELPPILSIRDAIKASSFHPNTERCLEMGDVDGVFSSGEFYDVVQGEVQIGGQEHFYMETNSCIVWTVDSGNEVHLVSSTQSPHLAQESIARVLGLPLSKVVCKTKRIGGGFGGKETRASFISAAASVASFHLRRPVKLTLDRDIDMMITGQRHSFFAKYKVGFTKNGKILALDLELYNNGGNSLDLSLAVLERAILHSESVYDIPNIRVRGQVCFTNFPSNTAFRGFGAPQGQLIAENWIQQIAARIQKSPEEIRELNFHNDGTVLPYGQVLQNCTMGLVWDELKASCNFKKAQEAVLSFNSKNRWKKRGVAMIPTKFGISFTAKHMNQAGALVHVYTDGTVLVTHGGVEMGQGLHTKVAQVAASSFGIPLSCVFISETSTDKVPNASPTSASASSDLYGAAVLDACEQLKARMQPVAKKNKHSSFAELVQACYMERIDLSAQGFYITPDIGFEWKIGKGTPFRYFTYGAAFAEVEIDVLTGDFHTRVADIVMDLGRSINPAIDVGQIEGAFVQGLGWISLEELKWGDPDHRWIKPGQLYTCGPGTYKIPSINDIPLQFKVSLLKGVSNPNAIHSSKAVGEPPFFLASSVLFAIREAITAARAEEGIFDWFPLDNPATPERIRMACIDSFTKQFASTNFRPKLSV